ncbi:prokineticin-1 isoform X3 [Hyla sarda]|uniref:prokineticin-1 isoform X3 n=1 Tax=Hyla sarda TaxID=327740 RepID=UPI0024C34993|nr:prokineticin-1 isoform X3 [Hyla sarda]
MKMIMQAFFLLVIVTFSKCAVITGACERDLQCGVGSCCAISLWLRGLRMCTPMGQEGEECHPFSHKMVSLTFINQALLGKHYQALFHTYLGSFLW